MGTVLYHKSMKKKLKIILFPAICSIALFFSVGFTDAYFEISKHLDIFTTVYKEINTLYVDDTDPGKLMKKGIDEMLKSLDPYTNYIPESEIEDFKFMTTGQYGGIGAIITKIKDYVYITEPYEGYPAQKAGLIAGDKILEIDGKNAQNKTTEEVSKILKGQPNTAVTLLIERKTLSKPFEVSFNREKVSIASVPYSEYVTEGVAYIKLRSFTKGCANDLRKAIQELKKKKKLEGLILDLRNNPGGLLNESVDIVNLFVDKGETIVSTKGKIKSWEKTYKSRSEPLDKDVKLAILINSASASASEIVAGSIQDLDRGVVIGQRSFGKGLVQQTRKLSYNSQLKLTVAKYYIPSGRCIQALDYSNRNEDGSVGEIADSLITEFTTRNGRKVYDGGGISPDFVIQKNKLPNIIVSLFKERLFFNYSTDFYFKNNITWNGFNINAVACFERWYEIDQKTAEKTPKFSEHKWITNLRVKKSNLHELCNLCARKRWGIEDSNNTEKNRGYHYTHAFSYNWNGMWCFHLLMRLAHAINALSEYTKTLKNYMRRHGVSWVLDCIKETFWNPWFTEEWINKLSQVKAKLVLESS